MRNSARRQYPGWLAKLFFGCFIIVFIISLPLTIPVAVALNYLDNRRMRNAAKGFACEVCSQILGLEAIAAADKQWAEHIKVLMANRLGARIRLPKKRVHAICPNCKTEYTYLSKKQTFIVHSRNLISGN